jgi:hypothetical protein
VGRAPGGRRGPYPHLTTRGVAGPSLHRGGLLRTESRRAALNSKVVLRFLTTTFCELSPIADGFLLLLVRYSRMVECPLSQFDSRITEKLFWDTAEAQTAPPGTSPPPVLLARMRPAHGADVPPAPRSSAARTLARQWPYITGSGVEGVAWRGDRRWRARGDVDGAERQMRPSCARWPTDTQRHSCTREP